MKGGAILPRWFFWLALAVSGFGLCGLTGSSWLELVRGGRLITGQCRSGSGTGSSAVTSCAIPGRVLSRSSETWGSRRITCAPRAAAIGA